MEAKIEEIWKGINGYEEFYEVSTLGRFKTLKRTVKTGIRNNPTVVRKERILKGTLYKTGYIIINLLRNDNVESAHRLVAQAFIPNPDNLPCVNHKNGVKIDNRVERQVG